jgi:hypothetical protein
MKKFFVCCIAFLALLSARAQDIPNMTVDYDLSGYPSSVRYMKFESDSALKSQRTSFIDDFQLEFNNIRQLTERVNFIDGKKDRYINYVYDNNKQLVKKTLMEANNKIVAVTTYEYNYLGRLAKAVEIEYPQSRGGANTTMRTEEFFYNAKGLLSKYTVDSQNERENKVVEYFYGPQDSLIHTISTFSFTKNVDKVTFKRDYKHDVIEKIMVRNDKQTRRETFERNDKGLVVKKEVFNAKDKKLLTYTYEYDVHNYMTSEIAVNDRGVKTIEYYYQYEKDKFFNWTKRITFDSWTEKYTEIRKIEYWDKEYWYEDLKDADTKRVIREN